MAIIDPLFSILDFRECVVSPLRSFEQAESSFSALY